MTDISETIALVQGDLADATRHGYACTEVGNDDLAALLDAAEAATTARDAAQIMLEALKAALPQAEGCFINHYGDDPWSVEASEPEYIAKMREAIAVAETALKDRRPG